MNAFFFGSESRPLFGYYHAPAEEGRGNILLCQPWGAEYQFAHRTMRFLARQLASAGWHVLRFDYSGTGDSWGDSTEANLGQWLRDTAQAAEELQAISGLSGLGLVGLRMGAYVAAVSAESRSDIRGLVLWDPITDGRAWIRELAERGRLPPVQLNDGRGVELGKQIVSGEFLRQVMTIDLADFRVNEGQRALHLDTQTPKNGASRFPDNPDLESVHLPQPSPWIEDVSIGSGQIPVGAVTTIVDWLGVI